MKKSYFYISCLLAVVFFAGCKKDGNYPGGVVNQYIGLLDVRDIYKGEDITLTKENMFGADKIAGVVISDHSGQNTPAGLLVMQDARRLGRLSGISIPLGADAASYKPGDSITVNVEGGMLKKVNGILQLTGLSNAKITKVASGRPLAPLIVKSNVVLASPSAYESTFISIEKASFDPSYPVGSTYAGDRIINDGSGNLTLHTEPTASWANKVLPFLSTFSGIVFNAADGKPLLWPRLESDIIILSSTAPKIAGLVITGYLADVTGTSVSDANYEYIQLKATKDIDFSVTPFSIVTTNNAGANLPTGFPVNGWATGNQRTYKIDIASGTILKGQYLYVGANKNINGPGSFDMSAAKWIVKMYGSVAGDGFGAATGNLLANSGNGAGIAVFDKITVDLNTVPVDVIFYGGAGMLFTAGPPAQGYRITNTDYYDEKTSALVDQPYYTQGSNTNKFVFPAAGAFAKFVGTYNKSTGRWTSNRLQQNVALTAASMLTDIESAGVAIAE